MRQRVAVVLVLMSALLHGCAGITLGDLDRVLGTAGALDEATVADGLSQALSVGAERASASLATSGGFSDDPQLRLGLPEELESMATALRMVGLGGQVDALETGMNRAAEAAAGEAVPVFEEAIAAMTIQDAFAILRGPDDAATRYFEERTSASLRARFQPVVAESIEKVGLYRTYKDLKSRYDTLPISKPVAPELETYVTDLTLAGLFRRLAEEEARIREDPAARSTALLRRVFGSGAGAS